MKNELLHTPEGVRDIYGDECATKLVLEARLHDKLRRYGYRDIETPSFEFFDIFNKERGSVASKNMFKFFDRDNNTLVLRPDSTPAVARCAAKYFSDEELPVKLCYVAKNFINNSSYQGKLKETTQVGAELIGDNTVYADAEILALVIDMLLDSGLTEFMVELSNVDYFYGLLADAGVVDEEKSVLRDLIQEKNYFSVESHLKELNLSEEQSKKVLMLTELFGSVEVLDKACKITDNKQALDAIERMRKIYELLSVYGFEKYISFDLGMLGNLDYYTGITFRAYTYGLGDPIVNGGRYDKLVSQFGKEAAAIGFSITSDKLLNSLERQKISVGIGNPDTMVLYNEEAVNAAFGIIKEHRDTGLNITAMVFDKEKTVEDYLAYAKRNNIGGILYVKNETDLSIYNAKTGDVKDVNVNELLG